MILNISFLSQAKTRESVWHSSLIPLKWIYAAIPTSCVKVVRYLTKAHHGSFSYIFISRIPSLIPHITRYSRACTQYSEFLERTQLQKLLKQGYTDHTFKSSQQKFHGHELVDRYEISISQMTIYPFSFI
jgi:hypothetical protein